MVAAYHALASDLKLVPATARNARGQHLSIDIDIRAKKREGLLKTDIRHDILPVLNDMHGELGNTTLKLRSELLAARDEADELSSNHG